MNEKKKILIVSYYFAPQNVIGAVRATKLAKYLSRMGHEVTVLCGEGASDMKDPTLARDLAELKDVHVVQEWNPIRRCKKRQSETKTESRMQPAGKSKRRGIASYAVNALYLFLLFCADWSFARRGMREIRRLGKRFDTVITSYGPLSAHWIGRGAQKQNMAARWIADFRDVVEMSFPWKNWGAKRYVKQVRDHADCITGVSAGYLATMGIAEGLAIPNGFDVEDLQGISVNADLEKRTLRFVYCGQMYGAERDLSPFFRAMSELVSEGVLGKDQILLEHAGKVQDADIFYAQATAFGLGDAVKAHGLLPRDEAICLQLSADAILVAAWNTEACLGNLPGKLLEVLMMDRPVICCTTGTVPGSESARIIRETGMGVCYEEAEGEASFLCLKAYVKAMCEAFAKGEKMPFAPNMNEVEKYAYTHVAQAFEKLTVKTPFDEPTQAGL